MTKIEFEREVSFTPTQMFDLVSDLAKYPDFVPNCSDMTLTDLPGEGKCLADMHVSFGPISQAYESEVHADRADMSVTAISEEDPFSYLESVWKFTETEGGAHIEFSVDFAMRNRLIAAIAEPLFTEKQREVVDAFIERAGQLYKS